MIRKRLYTCFVVLFLAFVAKSASATTYTWTGLGLNTNWNNNANWSPATGHPGSGDVAQIGVAAFIGTQPTINTTGLSCTTLTIGSATTVTLTVSNAFSVSGTININGSCTITGSATLTGANLSVTAGTLTQNCPINITSGITVTSAAISGGSSATFTVGSNGISFVSSTITLNGVLTCSGVVQVPSTVGTTCTLTTNATGNSLSGGIYDHTDANLTWNGSGTSTCSQGDVSAGQTLTIGSGNTVTFTGAFELHGASPLVGLLVNNGTISTNSSFFSDNISSAVTAITNNSGASITLTGSASLSLGAYTSLSNTGTITANSGTSIAAAASSVITNNSGGTITMTSATLNLSGNPSTLNNAGTFTQTSSTFNATGTAPVISNSGTFTASGSTENFSGNSLSFTNTGTVTATSSTAFTFSGNPQTFTNSATISLNASTITVSGNTTPITNSGNITLTNASTFTISGGSSSSLTNSGNFDATSSTLSFSSGSGNTITNSGNFIATSTPITFSAGDWTVNNSGTFSALSGSNITMPGNNSSINNTAGTFTVTSSNIALNGQPSSVQNSGTGTCSISGSTITLAQNAFLKQTSSNSFTINGSSTVNFGYGAYISNTGTFYAGTSNSQCILNVTSQTSYIASSTSNGYFYLGSTSIIYLSGVSASVTNTSPGTFTLQSDQYGSAAIGTIPSNATGMVGTFNVQRYYQGSTTYSSGRWIERAYRIISSPVNTGTTVNGNSVFGLNYIVGSTAGQTTAANSATNAFITGCTGGSTSAGNPSIYLYRESLTPANATFTDGNFLGITNITNSTSAGTITCSDGNTYSMPVGTGVFFFFRGAATNWSTRTVAPYIAPENVTLTSTGNINQQSYTYKDWYTPTSSNLAYTGTGTGTNHAVRGFNMVGNPYPCTIDWCTAYSGTGITRTNVNPTIYFFNPVTYQYDTYITTSSSGGTGTGNATRYIASGQGFFVQANGSSPSLVITESAKAPTSQLTGSNLYMGTPTPQLAGNQVMRLKLIVDSVNYDDMALIFNSSASTLYNNTEDALYIRGGSAPEGISSFSDDSVKLAINSLPLPGLTQRVIRLNVDATTSGTYTFQRTELDDIPKLYDIWLIDNLKRDSLDIRNNSSYAFDVNAADTTTFGENRFQLVIRQNPALMVHLLNFNATKATDGSDVVWTTENEENYTNFTLERSTDGGATYNVLGGVTASGQGTYSFLDKNPVMGANAYRLKIVDLNGTVTYSNVVTLMYANITGITASNIRIYPNPASSVVNLVINQNSNGSVSGLSALQTNSLNPGLSLTANNNATYDIKIINIKGAIVKTASTTQPNWQQGVGDLPPGTYVISVANTSNNTVVGSGTFIKL